jgi:predicted extracellular nuclease
MAKGDFSVTSFNLLNLNLPGRAMYRDTAGWSAEEYARKVAWTARMLRTARADLYGFQELWHPEALAAVLTEAGLAADYVAVTPPWLKGRHIACAAAVRRDMLVGEPEWIVEFPPDLVLQSRGDDPLNARISVTLKAFSRPVLHLRIRPRARAAEVHVFVCHFKSKAPTEVAGEAWYRADARRFAPHVEAIGAALSTIRRTAEAAALRVILTGVMRGTRAPVIVLGDLNDGRESNTVAVLSEQPALLRPLATGGRDTALYPTEALQEQFAQRDVLYTYVHEGAHGSLDHILVSEEFYAASRRRMWAFEGLDAYNDHLNDPALEALEGAGDHGVIRARFRWAPAG